MLVALSVFFPPCLWLLAPDPVPGNPPPLWHERWQYHWQYHHPTLVTLAHFLVASSALYKRTRYNVSMVLCGLSC